jgi:site-specific DNA-methyltransferase (adenine-specific)
MQPNKPQIEHLALDALVPYARNSRTHSPEQVAQIAGSIKEFGFTNPVLIDADGGIIAGHGRVMAARKLGLAEVPCIRLGYLSETQKRAYVIADNKLALNAGWDEEMLRLELGELREADVDLSLVGFTEEEIGVLLAEKTEGETDPDEVPEPPVDPVSVLGDVWVMGKHRVMCGSSTEAATVEKLMAGEKAALWITDPPYNVAYVGKTADALTIKNDSMDDVSFRAFLVAAYGAADAALKEGGVFYVWHADSEGFNFRGAAQDIGWKVRQCLVWLKSVLVMGRQDYQWKHEPCLYGWKEGAGHYWGSDRKQTTVLEFAKPSRNGEHPTMKPVELFAYQIENSSRAGDIVLDSFGGSGTTAIACEQLGRAARLMELDPKYVDVIVKRWQDFTGQQAIHEPTGKTFNGLSAEKTKR